MTTKTTNRQAAVSDPHPLIAALTHTHTTPRPITRTVRTWDCTTCDAMGEGPGSDRAAEKHTKQTDHVTITHTRPDNQETPPCNGSA
jgi:hypothetical protein